jgi:hypothetical protein
MIRLFWVDRAEAAFLLIGFVCLGAILAVAI